MDETQPDYRCLHGDHDIVQDPKIILRGPAPNQAYVRFICSRCGVSR